MTTEERENTSVESERSAIANGAQELAVLHARLAPHFRRAEVREWAHRFLKGLSAPVERKNGWQLADELGESGPQVIKFRCNTKLLHLNITRLGNPLYRGLPNVYVSLNVIYYHYLRALPGTS